MNDSPEAAIETASTRRRLLEAGAALIGGIVAAQGAAIEVVDFVAEQNDSNGWPFVVAGGVALAAATVSYIRRA